MYVPKANRIEDEARVARFVHEYGFGIVISHGENGLCASHLPILFDEDGSGPGTLRSHMARANPQWRDFESGKEVLCIFAGPHAYISPSWYVEQHTVPTWNYATVHVYGIPRIVDAAALKKIVCDTTDKYESGMPVPWIMPLSEQEMDAMLKAIVGFSIEITRVQGKFKLGQNRSREDQESMQRALQNAPDVGSRELADFIVKQNTVRE